MDFDSKAKEPGAEASVECQGNEHRDVDLVKESRNVPQEADRFIPKDPGYLDSQRPENGGPEGRRSLHCVVPEASKLLVPISKERFPESHDEAV